MNKKKLVVGVLGIGEVGSAIAEIVSSQHKILLKDLKKDEIGETKLDVLHICISYSKDFINIVIKNIKNTKPELVIVESTIPLLTIEKMQKLVDISIVHSPIRGDHLGMASDIKRFIKFIGSDSAKASNMARKYYATLGIKTKILSSSRATEMGKLLDTTYYALCIAWHQEMERFCKKYNVDFEEAVTQFNKTYNEAYKKTKPNVLRPILFPGVIGGHCLMPNIELLNKSIKSPFLIIIKDSNEKKRNEERA